MLKKTGIIALAVIAFASCKEKADKAVTDTENPFFHESELPYEAPPFDKIGNEDFLPAFEKGMTQQLEEIDSIANNEAKATFENTFIPLEKSGQILSRAQNVFWMLTGANTNPELQKIQKEMAPKMAAHHDAIYLNDKLFQRVKSVYDQLGSLGLKPEEKRLVEDYYQSFVRSGANLSDADKEKLKELNKKAASLSTKFNTQLLGATKAGALVVSDKAKLKGLSEGQIKTAAQNAEARELKGKWVLSLQNTTQQPLLQSLENRETRAQLFEHSWNRAERGDENDTRKTITELAEIRADQAKLLGYDNYAAWKLENQMAKTPETVMNFLTQLVEPAIGRVKEEAAELQKVVEAKGGDFELAPYDWNYYTEILRKEKYSLDSDLIRPYFELNTVLEKGVFYAATQLYGITFKERTDLPVWQDDVRVFELFNKDGSSIGLFYCDYFKRDNKAGGAWMSNLVGQSHLLGQKPVIYNVMNIPKPAEGEPALLSFDEVNTLFHEFGHALHGFFADQQFPSLSGTSVARDFVEFPSQFNEHCALAPKVFENYAVHYKTGEPMPQSLVDKIKKSTDFNQGYMVTELLEAALLDMKWHVISADKEIADANTFEVNALKEAGIYLEMVPPRYRSSYFKHIWGNGYAAGYYAYIWTHMLSANAFVWFQENGGLTLENGERFRKMVLSQGNTQDLAKMFKDFVGHNPEVEPLLKEMGLD